MMLQVLDRTIKVDYRIPSKPKVSQAAIDFIDKLLQGDPAKRLTIQGVYSHPWFKHGFPSSVRPSICVLAGSPVARALFEFSREFQV